MSLREPIAFAFYGTSLTTGRLSADWVPRLKNRLKQEPEAVGDVIVYNLGKGSQTSDWGTLNAPRLSRLRPTHILFEGFGINDCAIGPVSLSQSAQNFNSMIAEWQANIPGVDLTHQTMSPASAADVNRTNLQTYYNQELTLAAAAGISSLNHTPNWPAITAANTNGTVAGVVPSGFTLWDIAATWNSGAKNANITLSGGDLVATSAATDCAVRATTGRSSGKYYFPIYLTTLASVVTVGIETAAASLATGAYVGSDAAGYGYASHGAYFHSGATGLSFIPYVQDDRIGVAVDFSLLKVWFAVNGVWQNGDPVAGTGGQTITAGTYYPAISGQTGDQITANFANNGSGGDGLHPIWPSVFEAYSYPAILAWAKAKMGAFW